MPRMYNPAHVLEALEMLEFGDVIEVYWLDASMSFFIRQEDITENKVMASYKKQTGDFFAIKTDKLYYKKHLIMTLECHNGKYTVFSVPIDCLTRVTILGKNRSYKHVSGVGNVYLGGKDVKQRTDLEGVGESVVEVSDS